MCRHDQDHIIVGLIDWVLVASYREETLNFMIIHDENKFKNIKQNKQKWERNGTTVATIYDCHMKQYLTFYVVTMCMFFFEIYKDLSLLIIPLVSSNFLEKPLKEVFSHERVKQISEQWSTSSGAQSVPIGITTASWNTSPPN